MNQLFITISIILLPGVLTTLIVDKLIVHRKWDSFKYSLYSFIFGLFSYSILQVLFYIRDLFIYISSKNINWTNLNIWNVAFTEKPSIPGLEVILALIVSLPISLFISWLVTYKILNRLAQFLKISLKYGDENLFYYYLNTKEVYWVYIRDIENNLTYQGKVVSFSENSDIQEIVLSDVTIFRYEDSVELYSVPTIYLSANLGKFRIEQIPENLLGDKNEEKTIN